MIRRTLVLLGMLAGPAAAQAALVVETDGAAVFVAADGLADTLAGPFAPGVPIPLAPGRYDVTAVDDAASWDARRATLAATVAADDTARVALPLPVRYRIDTVPLGAALALDGRPIGAAPQTLDLPRGQTATLTARLAGHADARAALGGEGGAVGLALRPTAPEAPAVTRLPTQRAPRTRTWIDLGVGAAAVAAGAVAVHYKFRADALDDRYRDPDSPERGDEGLRLAAERSDTRSAVALGAMQVGLGVLAVRFILR